MTGVKKYPAATLLLLLCELIVFLMMTLCFQYKKEYTPANDSYDGLYSLSVYVSYTDGDVFSTDDAAYLLACLREVAEQYDLYRVQVTNDKDILLDRETIQYGKEADMSVLQLMTDLDQAVLYEMYDEKEMTQEYTTLYDKASQKGIYLDVFQHAEADDGNAQQVGAKLYQLLLYGTIILAGMIHTAAVIIWFQRRKKEYRIKYLFGEFPHKLWAKFCGDFLLVLLGAYVILNGAMLMVGGNIWSALWYGGCYMVFAFASFVVLLGVMMRRAWK